MNMNTNQKKQEQLNRGIAIAVAVLLALTLIVTVIAFSTSKRSDEKTPALTTTRTTQTTATKSTSQTSSTPAPTTGTSASTVKPPEGTGSSDDKPTSVLAPDFTCPLAGALVKDYSADIPVFSITMEDYRVHCGIDIGADAGTEVLAAADGEITNVYYDPMMGQTVEITHENGFVTIYKNMQTKMPSSTLKGAAVSAGDTIGYVGDTALIEISDSPHLHFEMRKDGESINPLSHIDFPEKDAASDYED
ncbi:MAG: M23 family metallopeptidase [Clostridia bacterium]|nr:M23 family metallopeptidase [Clostridia bacterium]